MTIYFEVTKALVSAGYLSEADMDAAMVVLKDALVVADAEKAKAFALEDIAYQEEVTARAEDLAEIDVQMGEVEDRFVQAEVINSAEILAEGDAAMIEKADAVIVAAYTDAAAALLAAELIDEANLEATVSVIEEVWVTTEED